jgi:muconolactone delta-isomerase
VKFNEVSDDSPKLKEKPTTMSREEYLKSAVKEWETALELRRNENVEIIYAFAHLGGGVAIGNANSEAELKALMTRLPFYNYLDINFSPIISVEDAIAKAKQELKAFKAQST